MRALAEAGIGIAVLPDYFVEDAVARGKLAVLRAKGAAKNAIVLGWRTTAVATARVRVVGEALLGGG